MDSTRQALILVAGEGRRLLPFTETNPKCLAEINGITILENALKGYSKAGVERTWIVVGHHADVVKTRIGESYCGMRIEYVENREYAATNSMYSLYLGLLGIEGPLWVLEGDVFFEHSILDLPRTAEISWFVDSSRRDLDGAYINAVGGGRAASLEIIRDLSKLKDNYSKSVGMLHLGSEGTRMFHSWLSKGVDEDKKNLYYDLIVRDHFDEAVIEVVDVKGRNWFEVDTMDDLENARKLFGG